MKLSGSAAVEGRPEDLFPRLLDPALLCTCIPGCESMERVADGEYATVIKAKVGPVGGSFRGRVILSEVYLPESYTLSVEGKSSVGHVQGGALVRLEGREGRTTIHYDGDARVSGLLATVGARLVEAAARRFVAQFFERLAERVSEAR